MGGLSRAKPDHQKGRTPNIPNRQVIAILPWCNHLYITRSLVRILTDPSVQRCEVENSIFNPIRTLSLEHTFI
jgi:hypothetical protein